MVRARRNRQRRRRIVSRPRRRLNQRQNLTTAPPRLSITYNTRRIVVPYGYAITVNSDTRNISVKDIFAYGPNSGLSFEYREVKVHRIRVFWQSDNGYTDAGSVCLVVGDVGENVLTGTFDELMTYPGSMTRKVYQNVSNVWFPTEPADRNWLAVDDTSGVVSVAVYHSIANSKLNGRIVLLCSVSVRGRNTARCAKANLALEWCRKNDITLTDPLTEQQLDATTTASEGFEHMALEPDGL